MTSIMIILLNEYINSVSLPFYNLLQKNRYILTLRVILHSVFWGKFQTKYIVWKIILELLEV